jgi:DNA primase
VARVQGGKDPADLVKEDPKLLKAVIGNAMHVIPFLIETIRRETDDERTMKLRVREEVVPFVTMIPNRIDAEHWEGDIASAIGTTADAIHFEVERVREEMKKEAAREERRTADAERTATPVASPASQEPPRETRLARLEDIVFHLWGVLLWQKSLESPHISPSKLGSYLTEILGDGRIRTLEDWPLDIQNKAAFLAEAAYEEHNERAMREALSALLTELEARAGKQSLSSVRSELALAERAGDRSRANELVLQASEYQKRLTAGTGRSFTFGD